MRARKLIAGLAIGTSLVGGVTAAELATSQNAAAKDVPCVAKAAPVQRQGARLTTDVEVRCAFPVRQIQLQGDIVDVSTGRPQVVASGQRSATNTARATVTIAKNCRPSGPHRYQARVTGVVRDAAGRPHVVTGVSTPTVVACS